MSNKKQMSEKASYSRMEEIKKDFKVNKSLYVLLAPVVIFYIIFAYGPMYGALIAFKDYSPGLGVLGSPWVGLKHFINFFNSPSFGTILRNTLHISITSMLFGFPAPIILALMLNELRNRKFSKIVQNASYLPHFISLVVVCGLIKDFTRDTGIITYLLLPFGVPQVSMLNYPQYFVPIYVASGVWQEVGWGSIIYLAALTGVDGSLYEAATIDGAGKWKQLWHVTIPGILPTVVIMFILRTGNILNVGYEKLILLYNDATLEVADVISTYVYRKGILEHNWSFSTAVNMFNSVVNLIFLLSANAISRKTNETSLW